MSNGLALVTGAAGHLGYNIVKQLCDGGVPVRAGIRTLRKRSYLDHFECEVVPIELMDPESLFRAMKGADVVYAAAAAFKLWAKNPEAEIVRPNIEGTSHLMHAAAKAGVRKVVYVSSIVTLDMARQPLREDNWNPLREVPYEYSKTDAEKEALRLAKELKLDISTILPGGIWGPDYPEPSPSTEMFRNVLLNRIPIDPNLHILVSDVRDVATACVRAATVGRSGERYMVVNEVPTSTGALMRHAQERFPELNVRAPKIAPRGLMLSMAHVSQWINRLTGAPAPLHPALVRLYWGAEELRADSSKARAAFNMDLTPISKTMTDSLAFAKAHLTTTTSH